MRSKARGNPKPPVESKVNNRGSKPEADPPDGRLQDILHGPFLEGLPLSQSPKEENQDDVKDREPKRRERSKHP